MPESAPLQVTVEITLGSGTAAGQRRFRLCNRIELPAPPALRFAGDLPLEGEGEATVRFSLPPPDGASDGTRWIASSAEVFFDPEHPESGSVARLIDLDADELKAIETYFDKRLGE